ncbi:Heat shock 70 kDa protein 12A [Entomortierella beljakovae]|nr:Heat shock 70 kDa protein 12A [Entomortierella beljakovae]
MLENISDEKLQTFRPVHNNASFSPASNLGSASIACHFDESINDYIVLWEDVQMAFKNAMYARKGLAAVSFLKGKNFRNLDPLRIRASPHIIFDVVLELPGDNNVVEPTRTELASIGQSQEESTSQPMIKTTSRSTESLNSTTVSPRKEPISPLKIRKNPQYKVESAESSFPPIIVSTPRAPQSFPQNHLSGNNFYNNPAIQQDGLQDHRNENELSQSLNQIKLDTTHALTTSLQQGYSVSGSNNIRDSSQGVPNVQRNTEFMNTKPKITPPNPQSTVNWDARAVEAERPEEQFGLGEMFEQGRGVQRNYSKALELYSRAAKQGHAGAQINLGSMYENNRGVPKNLSIALGLYYKAASSGNSNAQFKLGTMFANGTGVERDYSRAAQWYLKSANQGNSRAQTELGHIHFKGLGAEKNYTGALEWYSRAANYGNTSAKNSLGFMYAYGLGVPVDKVKAVDWYHQAADLGDSMAQNSLGEMFERGEGIRQNYANAIDFYLRSATQGNVNALFNLGAMHEYGKGIRQDDNLAAKWYCDSGRPRIDISMDSSISRQVMPFDPEDYPTIMGIDFGHLSSKISYAFIEYPKDIHDITSWPKQSRQTMGVPTYNTYEKGSKNLYTWGWAAMNIGLRPSASKYIMISKYKNLLNTDMRATLFPNGITVSDAISDYLTELNRYVSGEALRLEYHLLPRLQFRYIITAPPQWTDEAKCLLRQAASKALIKETDHPERLLLISDLDASVFYFLRRQKGDDLSVYPSVPDSFIIHYNTGDATYLTVYERIVTKDAPLLSENTCCRISGDSWPLEDNVRRLLERKFGNTAANFPETIIPNLVDCFSDVIKVTFDGTEDQYLQLPKNKYFDDLENPEALGIDDDYLILEAKELREQVFDPIVSENISLIRKQLDRVTNCSTIVLAGKDHCFNYFYAELRLNFPGFYICILEMPELSATRGATIAGLQGHVVNRLISRRCYGISLSQPFEHGKDSIERLSFEEDGVWCLDRFFPITKKGQRIGLNECITAEFLLKCDSGAKEDPTIAIYSIDGDKTPRYITEPGVTKFIEVPFQPPYSEQPSPKFNVKVTMTFRLCEVQLEVDVGGEMHRTSKSFISV